MVQPTILHDAVQQVVTRLKERNASLPDKLDGIQADARGKLRWLETRIPTGRLGNIDRSDLRAAIVLKHSFDRHSAVQVSAKVLATCAGAKQSSFEQLQSNLEHYLFEYDATTDAPSTTAVPDKLSKSANQLKSRRRSSRSVSSSIESLNNEKYMDDLSISLAGKILHNNPLQVTNKANKIYDDFCRHVELTSEVRARNSVLYDLQRYNLAYRAACWYMAAKSQGDDRNGSKTQHITPHDLADVSNSEFTLNYRELKQVLPHVEQWYKTQYVATEHVDAQPRKRTKVAKKNSNADNDMQVTKAQGVQSFFDAIEQQSSTNATSDVGAGHATKEKVQNSISMKQWCDEILKHAQEDAVARLCNDDDDGTSSRLAVCKVLEMAANEELKKLGIAIDK